MLNFNSKSPGWTRRATAVLLGLLTLQTGGAGATSPVGLAALGQIEKKVAPSAAQRWLDAQGQPLPFQSEQAITDFLENAGVVSRRRIGQGINGIFRMLLEREGIRLHAAFRNVRIQKHQTEIKGVIKLNYRDDAIFEAAAYRVSKLLGLDAVPPTVQRRIDHDAGTLQIWVEQAMTEKDRRERRLEPPDYLRWRDQHQLMQLFDYLIANDDRNQGNILFDSAWRMWLIDHTQAFRWDVPRPQVKRCARHVFLNLQEMTDEALEAELKNLLSDSEIRALCRRRQLLADHLKRRIESLGEDRVLFEREHM